MENNFLVGIRCFTYNQASYIEDALCGFTMQQTSFPYIVMVVDDASTDGEQQIIFDYIRKEFDVANSDIAYNKETKYANIIYAQHKTNKNCYIAALLLKENHYSQQLHYRKFEYLSEWRNSIKYEALCEGDDNWITKDKLEKQVKLLENAPDVCLVYTGFNNINDKGEIIYRELYEKYIRQSKSGYILSDLFKGNFILTCTTCFRLSLFKSDLFTNSGSYIDYAYFLSAASLGRVMYIPERTSNYRLSPTGLTSQCKERVHDIAMDAFIYFAIQYLSGKIKHRGFIEEVKIKIEIIIKALGLYHIKNNKSFMEKIFSIDKSLFLIFPFALVLGIKRRYIKL